MDAEILESRKLTKPAFNLLQRAFKISDQAIVDFVHDNYITQILL